MQFRADGFRGKDGHGEDCLKCSASWDFNLHGSHLIFYMVQWNVAFNSREAEADVAEGDMGKASPGVSETLAVYLGVEISTVGDGTMKQSQVKKTVMDTGVVTVHRREVVLCRDL